MLKTWGSSVSGDGQFSRAVSVATDSSTRGSVVRAIPTLLLVFVSRARHPVQAPFLP